MKIKASDIRMAMAKLWAAPEWAIMWEVGEGTGAMTGRYADAVMMSLWPSRGLELHGVEIKISRSDWKKEAADPTKAEAIARYCDRWWVHTSPGVVDDLSAMPPAWGLREWDGREWLTRREAEKTEAEQITRPFLAALLRRADTTMRGMIADAAREANEKIYAESEKRRQQFDERVKEEVEHRTKKLSEKAEKIAAFEAAFGEDSLRRFGIDHARLGAAALALHRCGDGGYGNLAERLRAAANEIDVIRAMSEPQHTAISIIKVAGQ